MRSHNTKPGFSFHKTPIVTKESIADAEVISAVLTQQTELALDDEFDTGSDPYNATGQHVGLMQKARRD
ncbi:MAG: hypothetical protein OSB26_07970 [Woeseiaceae bacterium]|jgi:hypothetical protein|nr:hypothetical protein [Woeseiaceae bacterium]